MDQEEHLKKVIAKERATHGLKQGFAEKAAALTQWIGEQAGFFRGLHFGKEEATASSILPPDKDTLLTRFQLATSQRHAPFHVSRASMGKSYALKIHYKVFG